MSGVKQDIFNRVVRHLLAQNARSVAADGTCMYRDENDRQCAVGCLIEYDAYSKYLEGRGVSDPNVRTALEQSGVPVDHDTFVVLSRLQSIHDNLNPETWHDHLERCASDFGLEMPSA